MVIPDLYRWPWEQTSQFWATIMMLFLFCFLIFYKPLRIEFLQGQTLFGANVSKTVHMVAWGVLRWLRRNSTRRCERDLPSFLLAFKDLFITCTNLSASPWMRDDRAHFGCALLHSSEQSEQTHLKWIVSRYRKPTMLAIHNVWKEYIELQLCSEM